MLTDLSRIENLDDVIANLPPGTAIIFRDYALTNRDLSARAVMGQTRKRGLSLIVGGDGELAIRLRADGLHLPEHRAKEAQCWKRRRPDWLVTVAAHSWPALRRAQMSGADAALLSPVFPTASHPERRALGPIQFASLVRKANLPVFALGGIDARTCSQLTHSGAVGIAGIGMFSEVAQK